MRLHLTVLGLLVSALAMSQDNTIYSEIGIGANANLPNRVPFWFRSNQYGATPLPGASTSVYGSFHKYYDTIDNPLLDWGGGLVVRGDVGSTTHGTIVEGYLKMALSVFEIKAGRMREPMGLVDSSLSSGAFAVSGNAPGIPQVEISMPNFYTIPVLDGLFAIKGSFSMGWLGQTQSSGKSFVRPFSTYLHQKSFYVRLGKPDWAIHLTGGLNHQVMYGGEDQLYGAGYSISKFQSLLHAATETKYKGRRIGNYLGSVDMGAEIELNDYHIFLYRQNFYDQAALFHFANLKDGLNGISITNKKDNDAKIKWHKVVVEFLYSNDQGHNSRPTAENYYNNAIYTSGWSYEGYGIGNPLLSQHLYLRYGSANAADAFINNRLVALHGGMEGSIFDIKFCGMVSYSRNYGTYSTVQTSTVHDQSAPDLSQGVSELSTYLELAKELPHALTVSASGALDYGKLLYNSAGVQVRISKSF